MLSAPSLVPERIGKYLRRERGRSRQHRHRVPVARPVLRARRRHQALSLHQRRRRREPQRPPHVPRRGAHGRQAAAPEHRADLRRGRGGRPVLRRHRARPRRAHAVGVLPAGQPAADRPGGADRLQVRQGAALRALARRGAPRHQAVQHPAHAGRRRAHRRLRHRAGVRLGDLAPRGRRRQPGLHVAGAGAGPSRSIRAPTSIRSARSCTSCCAASGRSAPARSASCCTRSCSRRRSRCATCAPRSRRNSRTSSRARCRRIPTIASATAPSSRPA